MSEAAIHNPFLIPLDRLVGTWKTEGTHPMLPDVIFHGRTTFKWMENGSFLIMHSEIDEEQIPNSVAVFGSDDVKGEISMLYFDDRKVSRRYDVLVIGDIISWWRNGPDLSQRYSWAFSEDDNKIMSTGEISKDGFTWEKDLELTYTKL